MQIVSLHDRTNTFFQVKKWSKETSASWYMVYMDHSMKKRTFWYEHPTKIQISLPIRTVWSESSFSAGRNFISLSIQNAPSENSDQTARMRSLIWIFAGRTCPKLRSLTHWLICKLIRSSFAWSIKIRSFQWCHVFLLASRLKSILKVRWWLTCGEFMAQHAADEHLMDTTCLYHQSLHLKLDLNHLNKSGEAFCIP